MISVVIPTANRPEYLHTALLSVINQHETGLIKEIIVSENGGSRASEAICRSFNDARIRYEYLDPPLAIPERIIALYSQATEKYVATLHDDDWWFPNYISTAARLLSQATANTCAFYCDQQFRTSEDYADWKSSKNNLLFWLAAGFPNNATPFVLSPDHILLACLLNTPNHYSASVWEKSKLLPVLEIFRTNKNIYDNDRLITAEMARQGNAVFYPESLVCVRRHSQQVQRVFSFEALTVYFNTTTERVIELLTEMGVDIPAIIDQRIQQCPQKSMYMCLRHIHPASIARIESKGLAGPVLRRWTQEEKRNQWKKKIERYLPQILFEK